MRLKISSVCSLTENLVNPQLSRVVNTQKSLYFLFSPKFTRVLAIVTDKGDQFTSPSSVFVARESKSDLLQTDG